jgi:hypothetical protein
VVVRVRATRAAISTECALRHTASAIHNGTGRTAGHLLCCRPIHSADIGGTASAAGEGIPGMIQAIRSVSRRVKPSLVLCARSTWLVVLACDSLAGIALWV